MSTMGEFSMQTFSRTCSALFLLIGTSVWFEASAGTKPNVILIITDDKYLEATRTLSQL